MPFHPEYLLIVSFQQEFMQMSVACPYYGCMVQEVTVYVLAVQTEMHLGEGLGIIIRRAQRYGEAVLPTKQELQ